MTNSSRVELRGVVEPWGFDFPLPPAASLLFEAENPSSDFFFDVQREESTVSVWYEGSCSAVTVCTPDGKRERFPWSLLPTLDDGPTSRRTRPAATPAGASAAKTSDLRPVASAARKIVLHARVPYDRVHNALLERLLDRGIALFCAVGVDCRAWEDAMDWTCIGPSGEDRGFVVTTSHPDESLADVVAFAEAWHLDDPSPVEIIEI